MKRFLGLLFLLVIITGCDNNNPKQEDKSDYIAWKSNLVEKETFSDTEELNCDITVSVDRVDEEIISYTTVISNPKEDMKSVKMMVVHNYFTEDIFPTIGVFDNGKDLLVDSDNNITLVGYIDTAKDIQKLDLELKIWIEYINNDGNKKDIYYKTTK